jgi:hypothetical protein
MGNNMKKIFSICIALVILVCSNVYAAVLKTSTFARDYSNIVDSSSSYNQHQKGYAVVIYKRKDRPLYGDFTYASGSVEAFAGRLFDIHLDGNKLEFKAKTSSGETNGVRSRELFEFKGVMRKTALVGTLTEWDGYDLKKPRSVKRVTLKREKTYRPLSYEQHQSIFDKDAW